MFDSISTHNETLYENKCQRNIKQKQQETLLAFQHSDTYSSFLTTRPKAIEMLPNMSHTSLIPRPCAAHTLERMGRRGRWEIHFFRSWVGMRQMIRATLLHRSGMD